MPLPCPLLHRSSFLIPSPPFCLRDGERRPWTRERHPFPYNALKTNRRAMRISPATGNRPCSPCGCCLPCYLLHHFLSRTMGKEPVSLPFEHHSPIRSLFLKPLRPGFFPKGAGRQSPSPGRSGEVFPRGTSGPGRGEEAAGAGWEQGEPRSLCLRISLGTFCYGVNY